jgi:hypothetical protein
MRGGCARLHWHRRGLLGVENREGTRVFSGAEIVSRFAASAKTGLVRQLGTRSQRGTAPTEKLDYSLLRRDDNSSRRPGGNWRGWFGADPRHVALQRSPFPKLIVSYTFLWSSETLAGRTEAGKDRPCVIVLVATLITACLGVIRDVAIVVTLCPAVAAHRAGRMMWLAPTSSVSPCGFAH